MKKPIIVHVNRCKFAAKEPSEPDTESEQEENHTTKRYNLRSSTGDQINMIILQEPEAEKLKESIECLDLRMEKEKSPENEDYNLAKMKVHMEYNSKGKQPITKTLKGENGTKFKEQTMINMMPNHT